MTRQKIKKEVLFLLKNADWLEIQQRLKEYRPKDILGPLFAGICSVDLHCRWHAVSGFGDVVPRIARENLEDARIVMRRFLWSLNDESGGIGWGAPESMAEVMVNSDIIFSEYCHMLVSYAREDGPEILQDGNYLELPALQQGLLWGIGRLLEERKTEMVERIDAKDLFPYIESEDGVVRGLAARCLGFCGDEEALPVLKKLSREDFWFEFYTNKKFEKVSVSNLAEKAIEAIR